MSYYSEAYRACATLVLKHAPLMILVGGGALIQELPAKPRQRTTAAQRAKVLRLAKTKPHQSLAEVAAAVGMSQTMVWKTLKRAGLPTKRYVMKYPKRVRPVVSKLSALNSSLSAS